MPESTPTIRDIAKASGFSRSAVSAALNNRSNISAATRKKIQGVAERMGYKKDARIDNLMRYLSKRKSARDLMPIAWVHAGHRADEWQRLPWRVPLFEGARRHAESLGYRLDDFWLNDDEMNPRRMKQILETRGIRGIVICPPFTKPEIAAFDFDAFSCVELQNDARDMGFHVASSDFNYNFDLAMHKVRELGFRRPGYCSVDVIERWQNHIRAGRYLWHTRNLPHDERIPIFEYGMEGVNKDTVSFKRLHDWLKTYRPDILLNNDGRMADALEKLGYHVPDDISLASMYVFDLSGREAGIDQRPDLQGAAAIDTVIGLLNRGETGKPASPRSVQIKGRWQDGATVRPQ